MDKHELKHIRRSCLGLTQKDLAERLGVSLSLVQAWECGGREIKKPYEILIRYLLITAE